MMTMATSTADDISPWCYNNINCTAAMASNPLHESIALKAGTCNINSQKIILRMFYEKSLPGFPLPPTSAVVNHHDVNVNCQQNTTHPPLSLTKNEAKVPQPLI